LPPRSPDATPCDLFLWGYVKDQVYVSSLPASIPELKVRIRTAIETITADMLQTVRNELDYHVDVCRITKGAHIEHLYGMQQKLGVLFYKIKKHIYCYLKCIVYDKLLKPWQSFRITLYLNNINTACIIQTWQLLMNWLIKMECAASVHNFNRSILLM